MEERIRIIVRYLAPLVLFVGGVVILALRVAFWSLFLGIAAVQLGMVLIILGFDGLAKKQLGPESYHIVRCEHCGDPVAVPRGQTRGLCADCKLTSS